MALAGILLATACGTSAGAGGTPGGPVSAPDPTPSPSADPVVREVSAAEWKEMVAVGMWRKGCPATRESLRRLEINHHGFDGTVHRGVLVVNADTAESFVRIFSRLFDEKFPIRSMRPLEEFDGDSNASLRADNTAAYNCRRPDQINAPPMDSPHANGRAVDINPRENPWKDTRCKCWSPSGKYSARNEGTRGVIVKGGVVWQTFIDEGWIWQNIKVPDYMHFDTGYPSRPYAGPSGGAEAA